MKPSEPDYTRLIRRLLLVAIVAGVAARVLRMAMDFQLWGDEAYIGVNIVERTWRQLLEPLNNRQVAPPLFLWAMRGMWRIVGVDWALRVPAFLSAMAGIGVMGWMVGRHLRSIAGWWAMALFAATIGLIFYSAQAKPFAGDALVAALVMVLYWQWICAPSRSGPLWVCALLSGPALWWSFPSAMVLAGFGGAAVLFAITHRRDVKWHGWTGLAAVAVVTGVSAFVLKHWVLDPQAAAKAGQFMQSSWAAEGLHGFPPGGALWRWPLWLIDNTAGKMLSYPWGDKNFASTPAMVLAIIGAIALWRGGGTRRWLVIACGCVWATAVLLATAHVYPYGGHIRVMLYMAPMVCVLMGGGIAAVMRWLDPKHRDVAAVASVVLAVVLIVIPMGVGADMVRQGIVESGHGDVRALMQWVADHAGPEDAVVVPAEPNPHEGSGPKIQFEYYLLTRVKRPVAVFDPAMVDQWRAGRRVVVIVYDRGENEPTRPLIDRMNQAMADRATVLERRSATYRGDKDKETTTVTVYEINAK